MVYLISISCFISIIFLFRLRYYKKLKKNISTWQIDDVLMIYRNDEYAILKGWTMKCVIVQYNSKGRQAFQLDIDQVKSNRSDYWRKLYKQCEITMGVPPDFNPKVLLSNKNSANSTSIHGKPINLLTETECQIYLKECLEREEYELAELIKKQMEKFR